MRDNLSLTNSIIFVDNLSSLMCEKTPETVLKLLKTAGAVADELGYNIYVVGGYVRDLLLDRTTFDIDIVVEGDGIKTARRLTQLFKSDLKIFDRFETACFKLGKYIRVDVVTARREFYTSPASLPQVERSSFKYDLNRRDFTINTLAVCINSNYFGYLVDCYNGRDDLKNKTIRVLHSMSFIDDPTRIIRAVRFEQRYRFKMDPETLALAIDAVEKGIITKLSRDRILNELYSILEESKPWRCIERLDKLGVMKSIFPGFVYDDKTGYYIKKATRFIKKLERIKSVNKAQVMLLCIFGGSGDLLPRLPTLLKLSRKKSKDFMNLTYKNRLFKLLNKNIKSVCLYDILKELSLEFIVFLYATSKRPIVQKNLVAYIKLIKKIQISTKGRDLIDLGIKPGPHYKTIFNELTRMKLAGKIKSKADELRAARHIYLELQEDN